MAEREQIVTSEAPAAVGAYSQAVRHGDLLWCSGQIPLDPESGEMIEGDVADEARRCLQNLDAVARAAGASLRNAVRCTIYLVDMADFAAVNAVYGELLGEPSPARACVAVAGLPRGARVEIDAIVALA